jgi:DNA-directed RNA polymerase specialized sigma24 family protein
LTAAVSSTKVDGVSESTKVPSPSDPAAALAAVVALRRMADRLERAAVDHALAGGWTWAQIAEALGVTPQAAHKRLGAGRKRPTDERKRP